MTAKSTSFTQVCCLKAPPISPGRVPTERETLKSSLNTSPGGVRKLLVLNGSPSKQPGNKQAPPTRRRNEEGQRSFSGCLCSSAETFRGVRWAKQQAVSIPASRRFPVHPAALECTFANTGTRWCLFVQTLPWPIVHGLLCAGADG